MRILYVIPYFKWSFGGPVRVVYELANLLVKRGHDVTIYSTDVGIKPGEENSNGDINFSGGVKVRYFRCLNSNTANIIKVHISRDMRLAIRDELESFDIIHLHEYRSFPNIYIWYYATKYKIPYVLQAHGSSPLIIGRQKKIFTILKKIFDTIVGRKIINCSSKLIALNKEEIEQYTKLGADKHKIEIIPNGINITDFDVMPDKGDFRKMHGIERNTKVILFLGRINKNKGIDLLLNAYSELIKELPNTLLLVVGPDDGYLLKAQKLAKRLGISHNVLFTGPMYGLNKIKAYIDADVYVLPSYYEIYGITALEAVACGTPTIVTTRCGIINYLYSYVYTVDYDVYQLKNAILLLLSNYSYVDNKCKAKELKSYSWHNIAIKFEHIYKEIIRSCRDFN